ncbi:hypothetical protein [Burkholderia cenocepacia]|uniref:hypothetical protein n=1 Tax=Burkholderia cenocepacia TaxID=95486 RepID=UPI0020126694|nr:hypothetical protein [Burkholderia cenocepacia]
MIAADSLRIIVLSGVSIWWRSACRRACSASASAPRFALLSHVQVSCLERARPMAVAAFAGALAARAATPPGRRCPERQRGAKAEGKTKGRGTGPRRKPVCTWGGAARRGFAAVLLGARGPRQYGHVRVLRTTGHARVCRENGHDRPPR